MIQYRTRLPHQSPGKYCRLSQHVLRMEADRPSSCSSPPSCRSGVRKRKEWLIADVMVDGGGVRFYRCCACPALTLVSVPPSVGAGGGHRIHHALAGPGVGGHHACSNAPGSDPRRTARTFKRLGRWDSRPSSSLGNGPLRAESVHADEFLVQLVLVERLRVQRLSGR